MTGDGVNDVLALKDADCSVAMASGSEAASQVAQVVLLDNDFSKMPSVVLEGRRVVNNIQRSAGLFFVKNIFSFILSILSLVFMFSYPLEPSQISFISMFTIGIPGFFLALEPDKSRIEGRFLPNVMKKAIPGEWQMCLVWEHWYFAERHFILTMQIYLQLQHYCFLSLALWYYLRSVGQ